MLFFLATINYLLNKWCWSLSRPIPVSYTTHSHGQTITTKRKKERRGCMNMTESKILFNQINLWVCVAVKLLYPFPWHFENNFFRTTIKCASVIKLMSKISHIFYLVRFLKLLRFLFPLSVCLSLFLLVVYNLGQHNVTGGHEKYLCFVKFSLPAIVCCASRVLFLNDWEGNSLFSL